jgi:hypothetical protein
VLFRSRRSLNDAALKQPTEPQLARIRVNSLTDASSLSHDLL